MSETSADVEKRRYPRYVFTQEENVKSYLVILDGTRQKKVATIVNISLNGMGLVLSKHEKNGIHEGDLLRVERILALDEETWINTDLTMKLIWVLDHSFLENTGFGCEFQNPSEKSICQVVNFINSVFPKRIP
jgi:hypothetical protein